MRQTTPFASLFTALIAILASAAAGNAQCVLPYVLTNGTTPDATQVMANFNALVSCLNPGGAANAVQYKASAGSLGGIGPLGDGQLGVGSIGNPPQSATLTGGSGIAVTSGAGSITLATTIATTGTGLYRQVMSATPTSASTGLANWLNQGTAAVSDSSVGLSINAPSAASLTLRGRYVAAPAAPYTITALIGATRNGTAASGVGIGWYDGTAKLHVINNTANGGAAVFQVTKFNSVTSSAGNDFASAANAFPPPVWVQLRDDGTNVSFAFSYDGANFLPLFSVAKASGFLGASGYSNIIFFVNPQSTGPTLGTLLSWTQS